MNILRSMTQTLLSSPTWQRDRAELFSGFLVGLTGLLLNGLVLALVCFVLQAPPSLRPFAQQMDFGQLIAPILLAAMVLVLLVAIPLRFTGLFLGPRLFRYFDQIVLSGISPLRYVIGGVAAQNLYFLLALFLLVPWLVLAVVLGGVHWPIFLGNLLLVWLFCMMLSMLMVWLSLYMPEWAAFGVLISGGLFCCGLGAAPIPGQPMVMTPIPAVLHSFFTVDSQVAAGIWVRSYGSIFLSSAALMALIFSGALLAVHLGPLFGLIRNNSTFGEVVYAGDSRLKRRLRFRYHIQRPSELAFFYQNRDSWLRSSEGLIRWLMVLLVIGLPAAFGWLSLHGFFRAELSADAVVAADPADSASAINAATTTISPEYVLAWSVLSQVVHGVTLVLAAILFSQGRSTTFQRIPWVAGLCGRVSQLDWAGFLLVLISSSCVCLAGSLQYEDLFRRSLSPEVLNTAASHRYAATFADLDVRDFSMDATLITSACGVTVYLLQRVICLGCWLKTMAATFTAIFWFFVMCLIPMMAGLFLDSTRLGVLAPIADWGEKIAMLSPLVGWLERFRMAPMSFGHNHSLAGFLGLQVFSWLMLTWVFIRRSRQLRSEVDSWQVEVGK